MSDDNEHPDLSNFGVDPTPEPTLRLTDDDTVIHKADKTRHTGSVYEDINRDLSVYVSHREKDHYYYKGGGYAISTAVLDQLTSRGVDRLIFQEVNQPDATAYEFRLSQYLGDVYHVPTEDLMDKSDPQVYLPTERAIEEWDPEAIYRQ